MTGNNCQQSRSPAGVIDSDNFRRRRADGQRPHPVRAHRRRPDAAPRASSRPTHLCAGMTAGVPDWWGAVGSALHTVSRRCSPNGPPPMRSFFQNGAVAAAIASHGGCVEQSAVRIASYVYSTPNLRVVRPPGTQDWRRGGRGERRFCQSFDWDAAASGSRRLPLAPRQAAVETGDVNTSAMAETWRVNLQFAAVRCRTVPFGTILSSSSSQRQRQPTPCCAGSLLLCRSRCCAGSPACFRSC
jgi:hypothetical protein